MLNNKHMLPDRIRTMRQMKDVINAEDVILLELERMLEQLYQRADFLHKDLINEQWLEENIGKIVNGIVHVEKEAGKLCIAITLDTGKIMCLEAEMVIQFINKWLPAHLAYTVVCEKTLRADASVFCLWQDDEIMTLREVSI